MDQRTLRKQQTRKMIVEKTTSLIRFHGYLRVSTRMIASSCGISQGTIFVHFKSKESLLKEVLNEGIKQLKDDLTSELNPDMDDQIFINSLIHTLIKHEDILTAIYMDYSVFPDDLRRNVTEFESYLKQVLFDHFSNVQKSQLNILDRFLLIDSFLAFIRSILTERSPQSTSSLIKQKRGRIVRLYKMFIER